MTTGYELNFAEQSWQHSDSMANIFAALSKVQAELPPIVKDSKNPHYKSEYASLSAVIDASRELLGKHGLSLMQIPICNEKSSGVLNLIGHTSGEWIAVESLLPLEQASPQKAGSAITYARRYSLKGVLNAADVDDDAESAEGRAPQQTAKQSAAIPPVRQPPKKAERDWQKEIASAESLTKLEALREEIIAAIPKQQRAYLSEPYFQRKQALEQEAVSTKEVQTVLGTFAGSKVSEVKGSKS